MSNVTSGQRTSTRTSRRDVVVIGAGFGGMYAVYRFLAETLGRHVERATAAARRSR